MIAAGLEMMGDKVAVAESLAVWAFQGLSARAAECDPRLNRGIGGEMVEE